MLQAEAATAAVNVESTPGRCGVESKLKECRTQASTSRLTESPGSRNLCATPNRTLQRWPDSWTSGCGAMKVNSRRPSKFCAVPSTKIGLTVTSSSHEPDRSAGRRSAWNDDESEEFPRKRGIVLFGFLMHKNYQMRRGLWGLSAPYRAGEKQSRRQPREIV